MSVTTSQASPLPLERTVTPASAEELAAIIREASQRRSAIYPLGGETSLDYGLPATKPGTGVSLAGLQRVIDYPARDMTITVEAGMTLAQLAEVLATQRQWLPIDVPQPEQATLGGAVACAASGPRRAGAGTLRDYVLGIHAVDGRGMPFKGGGRVVKNVAGYDFCKLLTGSLGTLGVVTQLTLKIRPLPERSALAVCEVPDLATAEKLLAARVQSAVPAVAEELLVGPAWQTPARLVLGLEGTESEVAWMSKTITAEWQALGVPRVNVLAGDDATPLWQQLREFAPDRNAPLVLKASVRPSAVTTFIELVQSIDPEASCQAHAATGVILVRFTRFESGDVSQKLIGQLQPAAVGAGGSCVVLSSSGLGELTRQAQWGGVSAATTWMTRVKAQFDPYDVLNPGRFVYEAY